MARTHNPFAAVERSKVETPWGVFEVAPPNKARLAEIEALQKEAASIADDDLNGIVGVGMRTAAAGVERGEELLKHLQTAWDAGELTVVQVRSLAEFIGAEIAGEVDEGNG
jgi:hypothetical protein